jgi:transcriptional regulator with GAF, ATPase, and Fis domain
MFISKPVNATDEMINTLLLEMAQQRSMEALFQVIVDGLTCFPMTALARIWVTKPGDVCKDCSMLSECSDQSKCLHLAASSGHSIYDTKADWTKLDGSYSRFPIGARKVGYIALSGTPLSILSMEEDHKWIAQKEWAKNEGIKSFAGYPLVFRGEVLGVLAVFARAELTSSLLYALQVISNHAASALANTIAFEEIDRLKKKLELENNYLRNELQEVTSLGGIIGKSPLLQKVLNQVEMVAPTNAGVLIHGESGTGKELVAREIHHRSLRKDKPMIKVNCASIPRELFAGEFFGHVKGAFTGAVSSREGRFGAADGGTIFLDEIGEIPLELQSKLLRVLQEGEYERVGEDKTRKVDVRIIAATNRDLKKEVEAGKFREDLYFRLNVFPIEVPPLRQRVEDVAPLADYFLQRTLNDMNRQKVSLTMRDIEKLQAYEWPGNIRELQNIMERAAISSVSGKLRLDLPNLIVDKKELEECMKSVDKQKILTESEIVEIQRTNTIKALEACNWKIYGADGAADLLGVRPTTLSTRIKKMNIKKN